MFKQILKALLFLAFMSSSLNAQEVNQLDAQGRRHGQWRKYYDGTKQLRYEGTFEHGQEIGTFKFYGPESGNQPEVTKTYTAGRDTLDVIYYTKEALKVCEGPMRERQKVGNWRCYHQDGFTLMIEERYRDGKLEGDRKVYFKNGQLAESSSYTNGLRNGLALTYGEDGTLLTSHTFKNNLLEGPVIIYDKHGIVEKQGTYKNNRKHGLWTYYKHGRKIKTITFPQNKIGVQD